MSICGGIKRKKSARNGQYLMETQPPHRVCSPSSLGPDSAFDLWRPLSRLVSSGGVLSQSLARRLTSLQTSHWCGMDRPRTTISSAHRPVQLRGLSKCVRRGGCNIGTARLAFLERSSCPCPGSFQNFF